MPLQSLLIERLTKGAATNAACLHLTSGNALRRNALGRYALRRHNATRGYLISSNPFSSNTLCSNPINRRSLRSQNTARRNLIRPSRAHHSYLRRRYRISSASTRNQAVHPRSKLRTHALTSHGSLPTRHSPLLGHTQSLLGLSLSIAVNRAALSCERINRLTLGGLHRKPAHLAQIATSLPPAHRLRLRQRRRHLRISSQISVTSLRGIGPKLGKTKLRRLRLKALPKRRLTASRHIRQVQRAVEALSSPRSNAKQGVLKISLVKSRVLRTILGFRLKDELLEGRIGHLPNELTSGLPGVNRCGGRGR